MHNMQKLGWVAMLASTVALGGCDDDDNGDTGTSLGTSATMTATDGTDTDASSTDATDTMATTGAESGDSSSGGTADCEDAPSHAADIQPIWDAACVTACHEAGGSWPSTDLTAAMAYDMLVDADGIQTMALADVKLVIPGDTENSYLLNKLDGTQMDVAGAAGGTQMPQEADPLTADQIALVEEWIACGAEP